MKEPMQCLCFFLLGAVLAAVSCELSDSDVNKIRISSQNFASPLYRVIIPHGSSYTIVCPQERQTTNSYPVTEGVGSYLDTPNHLSCNHPFPDFSVATTTDRGITVLIMSARYAKLEGSGLCMDTFACDSELTSQCNRYTSQTCALTAQDTLQLPGCRERPLIVEYDCRPAPVMVN